MSTQEPEQVRCPMCGRMNRLNPARPFCGGCGARLGPGGTLPAASAAAQRPAEVKPPAAGLVQKGAGGLMMGFAGITFLALMAKFELVVLIFALLVAAGGWALWRAGSRSRARAEEEWVHSLQLQVLNLARHDPRLTVMEVAQRMGWPIPLAERVLTSLDDGARVYTMPNVDGIMVYEFRELMGDAGDRPLLP